jgi:hypothetical protein
VTDESEILDRLRRACAYLDGAISNQRWGIRMRVWWSAGIGALGALVILFAHLLGGDAVPDALRWPFTIGGTCISSFVGFPIRDIVSRRDRIAALDFLRADLAARGESASVGEDTVRRLEQVDEMARKMGGAA